MDELKNLLDADVFLGRGWNFPPQLTENGVQSLRVLFSTSPGERVNRYDYGCPLRRYTFEPIYTQTLVRMRADIARAITLFEPRITLEEVSFEERSDKGLLLILITYTIIRTNSRNNMVYPFYLNEGTNINL